MYIFLNCKKDSGAPRFIGGEAEKGRLKEKNCIYICIWCA